MTALLTNSSVDTIRKLRCDPRARDMRRKPDQAFAYASWWGRHTPLSLRPFGARSSH
jgi:hypothetical protein